MESRISLGKRKTLDFTIGLEVGGLDNRSDQVVLGMKETVLEVTL